MKYLLYNPLSNNFDGEKIISKYRGAGFELQDITKIDLSRFLTKLELRDEVYIAGGDGTISIFCRYYKKYQITNNIYVIKNGTGNDFIRDIEKNEEFIKINSYLNNLPIVEINNEKYPFINNVGYGIDGEVCKEAECIRSKGRKRISYTLIAIKLLLFKFKRPKARVKIDGRVLNYSKVYLASAMNSRYCGGGMIFAPKQDRLSNKLSLVVMYKASRLHALIAFGGIFSGKLSKKTSFVHTFEAKSVEVEFDSPCTLQLDGEVFYNVKSYKAYFGD